MTNRESFDNLMKQESKATWGKGLGVAALLLALVTTGCSRGDEKTTAGKAEQKTVAQETVIQETVAKETVAPTKVAPPPAATKIPEAKKAPQVEQPAPSLGMTPEEFRLRFNQTSEFVKSKLRIKKLKIEGGANQDTFKHIFNENLYLTGEVNKADGLLAEINFAGVLNGSLATTVDLNVSFGTVITAFSPRLSPDERDSVLYALGITNTNVDIYTLDKTVTKNGITYWVKSTRKSGIRFGARSAAGN